MLAQENRARVADALQPFFGHGENADLIDGAEAVFDRPHQAKARMRVAFKVQHGVHHVFKHAGAGQRAFFCHMADQHDADATRFSRARQVRRAFAHLRDRTRRRSELVGIHGLNRVDDGNRGLCGL